METLEIIVNLLVMVVCGVILLLTLKSHRLLKRRQSDTNGKKAYRWLVVLFSLNGILWGFSTFTCVFMFASVLVERLIVYRRCYGSKTSFGRMLARLNW